MVHQCVDHYLNRNATMEASEQAFCTTIKNLFPFQHATERDALGSICVCFDISVVRTVNY